MENPQKCKLDDGLFAATFSGVLEKLFTPSDTTSKSGGIMPSSSYLLEITFNSESYVVYFLDFQYLLILI